MKRLIKVTYDRIVLTMIYDSTSGITGGEVTSVDAFYRDCMRYYLTDSPLTTINYEGRSSFHGDGNCNDW